MRRTLLLLAAALSCMVAAAQKKPLDHSVYDSWQSVSATAISPDGRVIAYEVNPQEGDGTLYIHYSPAAVRGKAAPERVITVERGYRARILDDGSAVVCLIKPFFKDSREARIRKRTGDRGPKDSLAIIQLPGGRIEKYPNVKGFELGKHATAAVAFASADTSLIPKAERKKKDNGTPVLVRHFGSGRIDTLRHIDKYGFDKRGGTLAFTRQYGKKRTQVGFYDVVSGQQTLLPDTSRFHNLPVFDEAGASALFLQADDSVETGSRHAALYRYDRGASDAVCLVASGDGSLLPTGWGLTENSRPSFSHDGRRIFAGVQAYQAPKDTSLVPFETAGLDIWNWDAPELPPMTRKNLQRDLRSTCQAVVDGGRLRTLTTSKFDRVTLVNRGDAAYALSVDRTEHMVETQWDLEVPQRVSLVDLSTGGRTPVAEGVFQNISASPEGRYVLYFDAQARHWMLYSVDGRTTRNLTEALAVNFWNEDADQPMLPDNYGLAGWTAGDREVLLYDKYDIWKLDAASGNAVNLTAGAGRAAGRTYRYINTKDREEERAIRADETLLLSVFDHATKENGIALADVGRSAAPAVVAFGGYSWSSPVKAKNAPRYLYRKGNFQQPMDAYAGEINGRQLKETKLSAINPQQAEYNWGTVELFHWNAYDGKRLDGLVFKPEDFDASKQYPVMIYFYEKNSETMYAYRSPAPSRSTVNVPFYVSRGYVVFIPDIVYTSGLPGESAYNCIVSGAEALARNSWIDRDNMAIQGQSWGGYQVAYLITRTSLFKAAGAGAPVANMTSAYGGIRWGSGMSRQFQYEQTQSRIGRDLWNGIELYMENSPLFKLPNVTTPVLIMHNDQDGAVPWYQGIELFMGLRRLGKAAWLLQYNDEDHNLVERRNCKDLSIRLQQFFDHYLKGEPAPAWMKNGVPTARKGQYFGFEYVE